MSAIRARGGLVGRVELAQRWNVSRQRVAQLVATEGFPEPVGTGNGGPLWFAADVDAWRANRRPGRPPKPGSAES